MKDLEKNLLEVNPRAKKVFDMLTDSEKDEYRNISAEKVAFFELPDNQDLLIKFIYANGNDKILLLLQIGALINEYKTKFKLDDMGALVEIVLYIETIKIRLAKEVINGLAKDDEPKKYNLKKKIKTNKLSTIGASAKIIKVDPNKKINKSTKKK